MIERTYLLEGTDDLRSMTVRQSPHDSDAVFIRREGATMTLSRGDAQALAYGILAVLSGEFDRACTETYLRLELETEAARQRVRDSAQANSPQVSHIPPPSLEIL